MCGGPHDIVSIKEMNSIDKDIMFILLDIYK